LRELLLYPVSMRKSHAPTANRASLGELIDRLTANARTRFDRNDRPTVVVSPYRFNPLGAHIDHQGGSVLARTLNQYSVGAFYPTSDASINIESTSFNDNNAVFDVGDTPTGENWQRYAMASAYAFNRWAESIGVTAKGVNIVVEGTMVGAGLSSSASIILAYLMALAHANNVTLESTDLVELCRQVENEHMGLNNGVQDQMSVAFGQHDALSLLRVDDLKVDYWPDPANIREVSWLVCYSGFSRELVKSGFNDRVGECKQAASLLHEPVNRLGDVPMEKRTEQAISALPQPLARRAMHVYSEMQRVSDARSLWTAGDWVAFGATMNASCLSSIEHYECGSEPMHFLHSQALDTRGVYGSRFSGGGYGGCLIMLIDSREVESVSEKILSSFLARYPEKNDIASVFVAQTEAAVRIL